MAQEQHHPLKKARLDCKLSQSAVAQRVGITAGSLSRLERGMWRPSAEVARKLHVLYQGKVTMEQCLGTEKDASLLRMAREARGWSLGHVAVSVGLDPASVSRIERGRQRPAAEVARRFFDLYGGTVPESHCYDPTFREYVRFSLSDCTLSASAGLLDTAT